MDRVISGIHSRRLRFLRRLFKHQLISFCKCLGKPRANVTARTLIGGEQNPIPHCCSLLQFPFQGRCTQRRKQKESLSAIQILAADGDAPERGQQQCRNGCPAGSNDLIANTNGVFSSRVLDRHVSTQNPASATERPVGPPLSCRSRSDSNPRLSGKPVLRFKALLAEDFLAKCC